MEIELSYQRGKNGLQAGTEVAGVVTGYSFILVKVIVEGAKIRRWTYELLQILVANRFNSAYYLVLNTGNWSGGETGI